MKLHKLKRHKEEMSSDGVKSINLEGSERMRSKKEVAEGMDDFLSYNDRLLRDEIQWEEEMAKANECYRMEQADPNYKCTCFEEK
jgi:hypothetical protein